MRVTYQVVIDVENDWDDLGIGGRKEFVAKAIRRVVMGAVSRDVVPLLFQNSISVTAITVDDPVWEGWDNERIARETDVLDS